MTQTLEQRGQAFLEVAEKATPRPWSRTKNTVRGGFTWGENEILAGGTTVVSWTGFDAADGTKRQKRANVSFIVAARNEAPGLVAELLAEAASWKATAEELADKNVNRALTQRHEMREAALLAENERLEGLISAAKLPDFGWRGTNRMVSQ